MTLLLLLLDILAKREKIRWKKKQRKQWKQENIKEEICLMFHLSWKIFIWANSMEGSVYQKVKGRNILSMIISQDRTALLDKD